jgi:hypothetical protein
MYEGFLLLSIGKILRVNYLLWPSPVLPSKEKDWGIAAHWDQLWLWGGE